MSVKDIKISKYKNIFDTQGVETSVYDFLEGVQKGTWQDEVLSLRTITDPKKFDEEKKKCSAVTISGSFVTRKNNDIRKHSGFIAIDIDNVENPETTKKVVKDDPYLYSAFTSISGKGLCLVFKIDGNKHLEAFEGLADYLYNKYGLISDQSCKNVARARFVSFDPYIIINEEALQFKIYLKKERKRKVDKIVFVESDFDEIINSFVSRSINICEDYKEWVSICFSIISEFGDSQKGREYFHALSAQSSKYDYKNCEDQYNSCLKNHSDGKKMVSTINSIYWHAKQNGIETYSKETKDIIRAAASKHKNGIGVDQIVYELQEYEDIDPEYSYDIVNQVISKNIKHSSDNIVDDIHSFLKPYQLRRNLITRNIEWNGKVLDDIALNSIYLDCKSSFKEATKDLVGSMIFSNRTDEYNPILEFLKIREGDPDLEKTPNLNKLLDCIETDTPNYRKWVTKWLVSILASAHGDYSPLLLVFSGSRQGSGKTHFFRYLLPSKLRYLFAESKMDNGKDDEILMTKKLIILDDEYGGKSKREEKHLKNITSKEFINVREPYGRISVDLRRLAVFCGTSNDHQILSDPTGNRRVLPINILGLNHQLYNDCDKEELMHELNYLYKSGYDFTVLKDEIKELNEGSEMFNVSAPEEELLALYMSPARSELLGEWMTATEIIKKLTEGTKYVFSNVRMGLVLNKFGYTRKRIRRGGSVVTAYLVELNSTPGADQDPAPF